MFIDGKIEMQFEDCDSETKTLKVVIGGPSSAGFIYIDDTLRLIEDESFFIALRDCLNELWEQKEWDSAI